MHVDIQLALDGCTVCRPGDASALDDGDGNGIADNARLDAHFNDVS